MAPSTSTTASPLSRILLSLPKPSTAQPSRCAKAPTTDSGAAAAAAAKKKNLVFSRREAAATAPSTLLSRVLPAVAAETDVASAATGECALETTPSGLAYCYRVVGAGAEAVKGQLIKVSQILGSLTPVCQ
jgi:peptidylprolyl isomerase